MRILTGVVVTILALLATTPVAADQQTRAQRTCITKLNDAGARLAKAVARDLVDCVKLGLAGRLPAGQSAEDCLSADNRRRVAKAHAKTEATEARKCTEAPDFGARDADEVNAAFATLASVTDVFGDDLDVALAVGVGSKATTKCQREAAKHMLTTLTDRLKRFNKCSATGLRRGAIDDPQWLAACVGTETPSTLRRDQRRGVRLARRCAESDIAAAFPGPCGFVSAAELGACLDERVACDAALAVNAGDNIEGELTHRFEDGVAILYCGERPTQYSVARQWNEEILDAIRIDFPRPPIHARNLLHMAVAMWDAWAAYDATADGYVVTEKLVSGDLQHDRETAISFAVYRVLAARYAISPNGPLSLAAFRARMNLLGYDPDFTDAVGDSPVELGNRIGAAVLASAVTDGANEDINYADPTYVPENLPLIVAVPGTTMSDPNRWQPLALDSTVTQNGIPVPENVQSFVGPQWGTVTPFAIDFGAVLPGPPPLLHDVDTDDDFKAQAAQVIEYSSLLSPEDPAMLDISPASLGDNSLGANDGTGYATNPSTGEAYLPQIVKRADFGRVLAEFWADGPTSETPPGHWNALANAVTDHPLFVRQFEGAGPVLDPLEWDVKMYLPLNAAVHDAAVAAWGAKRVYDYVRPISMIRYMGGLGQSTDMGDPSFHADGLPLVPGVVEIVTLASIVPGQRHEHLAGHLGEIAVLSWPGEPADPATEYSGVRWVLAEEWVAYQRATFVTPPFASYVSGHSTFSRAAAEVLVRITGSPFFPGGLGEFTAPQDDYLVFEIGPSGPVVLQWATYYDASDQAGQSRLWGGIHIEADDFEGRILGATVGIQVYDKAVTYFDGTAIP